MLISVLYFQQSDDGIEMNTTGFVSRPLYQQIVDWFRENHEIIIEIHQQFYLNTQKFFFKIYDGNSTIKSSNYDEYNYHEALNKAIEEAFKLI